MESNVNHSRNSDHREKGSDEDPFIWSREGQVEVGLSLDRLDVRPRSDAQSDSALLKMIQLREAGVFLRRIHRPIIGDGIAPNDNAAGAEGEHTDRKLIWKDTNDEDFVLMPMNMSASCRVYRNVSGSVGVGLVSSSSSTPRKEEELSQVDQNSVGTTIGSKGTMTTRRRGKREKRQNTTAADLLTFEHEIRGPSQTLSTQLSTETLDTCGYVSSERVHVTDVSLSSPHRLELNLEMGHAQSSLSPRQIFLIHSLSSSMTRMRRGRPQTTIQSARAHDRALTERMTEEGRILLWEERMYREVPPLRPRFARQSTRTLPGVVASWWKYAYFNVVIEIRQRRRLIGRCSGDSTNTMWSKTSNVLTRRSFDSQSRIRRDYINFYMAANSSIGDTTPIDEVAVSDASFRLAKMEDDISVERLFLLKSVARAASIRLSQNEDHSSLADTYYNFFPNSQSLEAMDRELDAAGNGVVHSQISLSPILHSPEIGALGSATGVLNRGNYPTKSVSFSANLAISGFSLEISDFLDGTTMNVDTCYGVVDNSDDISTLTGFSDDESRTIKHARKSDTFDPFTQFGSTTRHGFSCEPILVMHMTGIVLSLRRLNIDVFQLPQVNCEFSVSGISLQMGYAPAQQNIMYVGHIPGEKSQLPLRSTSDHSKGVSCRFSILSKSIIVGPTEIIVDWGWIERIVRFASINKDIRPVGATTALESENLLVRSIPIPNAKRVRGLTADSLEFNGLSLTIPLQSVAADDKRDQQYVIATANHLHIETVNKDPGRVVVPAPQGDDEQDLVSVSISNEVLQLRFFHLTGLGTFHSSSFWMV